MGIKNFDGLIERMSKMSPDCMVHEPLGFIAELSRVPASCRRRADHGLPLTPIRDVAKLLVHSISHTKLRAISVALTGSSAASVERCLKT